MTRTEQRLCRDARAILDAATGAAEAGSAAVRFLRVSPDALRVGKVRLPWRDFDRVQILAAGKAALPMAASLSRLLGKRLDGGIVLTKHGHAKGTLAGLRVFEAGHPVPDKYGLAATGQILEMLRELHARDLLLVAISGGASSLLVAPKAPITLAAKQRTTDLLLRAGAAIHELNAVRKHLSLVKGGRLAALAYPATVVSLLLSDVVSDDPGTIGSGPAAPDATTFADALQVLRKYHLLERVPHTVRKVLEGGAADSNAETPKPGASFFRNVHQVIAGSNRLALEAAARRAKSLGYSPLILTSSAEGEAREVARVYAAMLREMRRSQCPVAPPACLLAGGETTVTVRGKGKGGRNQEMALAAALALDGERDLLFLSAGTDGSDGPTDAAGAMATGSTLATARCLQIDPKMHLEHNDSYSFFDAVGGLIRTGPTGTNVMDLQVMLAL